MYVEIHRYLHIMYISICIGNSTIHFANYVPTQPSHFTCFTGCVVWFIEQRYDALHQSTNIIHINAVCRAVGQPASIFVTT